MLYFRYKVVKALKQVNRGQYERVKKMATILLIPVLLYLVALKRDDERQNKIRKIEQYREPVGCYTFV